MMPLILRIIMVVAGCLFLILNFVTYVKKNLTEKFTWMWTFFCVVMILSGIVPGLNNWSFQFNSWGYMALCIILVLIVQFIFIITKEIANLKKRNKELAMHVSLLNQENERILAQLEKLTGKTKAEL
ncbi:MAG: DUF2304 domain-containing protein [Lachnospira sp.]|nr:DUF2304 domain-containing protein [Clostridia bacterium]